MIGGIRAKRVSSSLHLIPQWQPVHQAEDYIAGLGGNTDSAVVGDFRDAKDERVLGMGIAYYR